jgi:hypothetical protein
MRNLKQADISKPTARITTAHLSYCLLGVLLQRDFQSKVYSFYLPLQHFILLLLSNIFSNSLLHIILLLSLP